MTNIIIELIFVVSIMTAVEIAMNKPPTVETINVQKIMEVFKFIFNQ